VVERNGEEKNGCGKKVWTEGTDQIQRFRGGEGEESALEYTVPEGDCNSFRTCERHPGTNRSVKKKEAYSFVGTKYLNAPRRIRVNGKRT